jgi:hypothetical protein
VVAGFIGAAGLRIVFMADVALLLLLGALVFRGLRSHLRNDTEESGDAALADP